MQTSVGTSVRQWVVEGADAALGVAVDRVLGPPRRLDEPPRLSGGLPWVGHMREWIDNPFALLERARSEGGEVIEFSMLGSKMVLLTGPRANEAFFRAPDDQLCRREAYKLMTPIFGEGVVFDAPGPRLEEQMRMVMLSLRDHRMRGYPPIVEEETRRIFEARGDAAEIDLLETMQDATLYASSRCLIGPEFRDGMDEEFRVLYHALEKGVNPIAYFQPYLPLPSFRRRDAARKRLVKRVEAILERRLAAGERPDDGLQTLIDSTYKDGDRLGAHEITGILIAIMMAGHHTSAGTASWVFLELLRHPEALERVQAELDSVWSEGEPLSYATLRQLRYLHDVIREVLRLHPPLIFLLRKVLRDFEYGGYRIPKGAMACASPAVTHRIDDTFAASVRFDPDRFARGEAKDPFAWVPFGGGKHKCTGNAFGLLQLKTISAYLLRNYDFQLVDPPESYRDNYNAATVMPMGPVRVRYERRSARGKVAPKAVVPQRQGIVLDPSRPVRIHLDLGLCQGHSVCVSEAPSVFRLQESGDVELVDVDPSREHYDALIRAAEHCPNKVITLHQPDVEETPVWTN